MATSLEQFRASLRNDAARARIGLTMSAEEANWIADDEILSSAYYARWSESRPAPVIPPAPAPPAPSGATVHYTAAPTPAGSEWMMVSGRTSAFVLGLLGVIFIGIPIAAIPLGIVGWVYANKALRVIPYGARGRGLATAGLVLSVIATCGSGLILLLAIPGALMRNF
ncbi:DUF4190 domain-containing protein [Leifsonia sp. H3M29-4]|uniref:DUF4190 domain-containing protein n=1 Tax=Salinibacterium metalliresistens TaxID=3031321 RepID=UPI0023D99D06|nr:DUF4190 domain-containing protein [Salinibacterium metalliresistens]MDF1477647.1 DUF4190 domain-containing protein [Salinibacterium metalliresistens]